MKESLTMTTIRINQREIDSVSKFVTDDMITDASGVIEMHKQIATSLFSGKVTCLCGDEFVNSSAWRNHVADIILVRHTALIKRMANRDSGHDSICTDSPRRIPA